MRKKPQTKIDKNLDTPRTNENAFGAQILAQEMVTSDFARELERELNDLKFSNQVAKDEILKMSEQDRLIMLNFLAYDLEAHAQEFRVFMLKQENFSSDENIDRLCKFNKIVSMLLNLFK